MNLEDLQYQRLIIGYHGCTESVRDSILIKDSQLKPSENKHDWLGHGIYFWEHGPERALDWAKKLTLDKPKEKPAVLGAIINLGRCFDLLDIRYTSLLRDLFPSFEKSIRLANQIIPENSADTDSLRRNLDCAMINWTQKVINQSGSPKFQSVRGVFQEDTVSYPGSSIHLKSHIQIAIRDPACILGYFKPHLNSE